MRDNYPMKYGKQDCDLGFSTANWIPQNDNILYFIKTRDSLELVFFPLYLGFSSFLCTYN